MLRRHRAAVALVVWTFLVWTTRIGNIWRDSDLETAGKVGRTALALAFTVLAVAVLVAAVREARSTLRAVQLLANFTIVFWVVRGTSIVVGDHDVGFKVVHSVLAAVSIALAALAWRETYRKVPDLTRTEAAGRRG
jgi:hypothetical protein